MVHAIMCLLIYLLLGCLFYSFMHCLHTCTRVSPPSLCGGACSLRIFHGINAVNKGPPWYPQELLNTTFVAELAATGATAVRLGVIWNGVMPSRGVLNMTYLGVIGQIVDTLAAAGIYSLLDAHQDGLSSEFCLYDAAPRWWIDMTHPAHAFPWPLDLLPPWCVRGGCSTLTRRTDARPCTRWMQRPGSLSGFFRWTSFTRIAKACRRRAPRPPPMATGCMCSRAAANSDA